MPNLLHISGSLYTGDFERAKEFYNLTREHLGYVFDVTDLSLALVLIPLSFLARYWYLYICFSTLSLTFFFFVGPNQKKKGQEYRITILLWAKQFVKH